jgi:hypothetical protein
MEVMRNYEIQERHDACQNDDGIIAQLDCHKDRGELLDAVKAIRKECQGTRDDHAPDEPKERELLEAIEAIVGRS